MVVVDVAVPARPDEFPWREVTLLRHHAGQKCVTRDVKGNAQKNVAASLIELAGEFAVSHIKLKETVTRRQRHFVDVCDIPGAHNDASAVGVVLNEIQGLRDLVDLLSVRSGPASPLHAVDGPEVAVFVGPFVPDRHFVVVEVLDVAVTV